MAKRFRDVKEMIEAMDHQGALDAAKGLVHMIENMGYTPPEMLPGLLAGVSQTLDTIADKLAIDDEMKRIVSEFFARAGTWVEREAAHEITVKPLGKGMIAYTIKDPSGERRFESSARYFLPHLGRALAGDLPTDPDSE